MDKYEFKIKAEQIQKLIEGKDYKMAAKIADGIDWRRVKNVALLTQVSEVYEKLKRYEDSYEILNMAYDRAPIGRMIVYKMAEIATYLKDFDEATELYKEFVRIAPHDLSRYILKYKIYEAKGAPTEDLIAILEEFKSREYHEKWAYELAVLYYKEGMNDKCVEECDDLVLWFSEGEYVRRAMELKMRIQPLTASQEQKYQLLVGEIEARRKLNEARTGRLTGQKPETAWMENPDGEVWAQEPDQEAAWDQGQAFTENADQEDIKIQAVDPEERYSTINLQAELAAGLRDILDVNDAAYTQEEYDGYGEAGYEEYPEEGYEAEAYGEDAYYEEAYGDQGYIEETYAEGAYGEEEYAPETYAEGTYGEEEYAPGAYGDQGYVEEAYTEESYGEEEYGPGAYGDQGYVEEAYAEESYGEEEYALGAYGDEEYIEESYAEGTYGEEEYGPGAYGDQGYVEESYVEESYGEEEYAEEIYGEEGYAEGTYEEGWEEYGEEQYQEELYGEEGSVEGDYAEGYDEAGYAEGEYPIEAWGQEDDTEGEYAESAAGDAYTQETHEKSGQEGYEEQPETAQRDGEAKEVSKQAASEESASPDRAKKLYLGQREDGQLTFDDQESVLDRQITGQMSIADIMAEWENKKQKMEAALERLAVQEEERRKESLRQEQEAGETAAEEACLIPPDVQQLLDEIEGKLPVKIIVEPIERSQPGFLWEKESAKPSKTAEEAEELGEILEFAGKSCETAAELTYEVWEDQEFYEDQDSFEDSSEEYDREETESFATEYDGDEEAEGEFWEDESYDEGDESWEAWGNDGDGYEREENYQDPFALVNDQEEQEQQEEEDELEAILRAALQEEIEENGDLFAEPYASEQQEPAEELMEEQEDEQEQEEKLEQAVQDSQEEDKSETADSENVSEPVEKKNPSEETETAETGKSGKRKKGPASSMMWDLEKVLEDELKHVSGGRLNEEQEKLFAYFTSVHGMNRQLSQFLEEEEKRELDGTSVTGNIVVTGESGNGKTTLAVDLVKAIQKLRGAKNSRMAKVTGESLNQRDVSAVVRKLTGGALVIEHAGGLNGETAAKLSGAMLGQTNNLFVVLEDDAGEIKRLFTRCESLAAKFNRTIEIPVFTNHELVAFGKSYGQEQGYVLDEMAVLALYNRIGNNQTSDHLVNVAEVKDMIDDAIISSSRRGIKKLFSKRRQDEFGNYVLMEKDFEL
ncbi:MAG: hypothetical protein HFI30_10795 [Lachnospiraceae bacterium]|nr:hypothetical protein [Lachnospiraceae bacterium]